MRAKLVSYIALACLLSFPVFSSENLQQKTKSTDAKQQNPERGTHQFPLFIDGHISTATPEEAEQNRREKELEIEVARDTAKYTGFAAGFTLLLVFGTAILAGFTYKLWKDTSRLVTSAEDTSKRQLRAYISITPKLVLNWNSSSVPLWVGFDIRNHGQTIGAEIVYVFGMGIFDCNQPINFPFPPADREYNQENSLFPRDDVPVRLSFQRMLTDEEIVGIENGTKRFHTWGVMHYRDSFNEKRTTEFSFSFGGPEFAKSMANIPGALWYWENGPGHNNAT